MTPIVWDGRWRGGHGIGRHGAELRARLPGGFHVFQSKHIRPGTAIDPLVLRAYLGVSRAGIFVSPGFNASLPGKFKQLLTIHDLIHIRAPDSTYARAKSLYYDQIVLPAILRARRVLTVSEASRAAIADWSGLHESAIVNVGNGCSVTPASTDELGTPRQRPQPLVLYVGNTKPHKNVGLLFKALTKVDSDIQLVTVGLPEQYVAYACQGYGVNPCRVTTRNAVSESELRSLYLEADCLALPSSIEGFGLPALEAMALGTPTVYVCDAVEEVVGSLGYRIWDADGVDEYAAGIEAAVGSQPAEARQALALRATLFSWDSCAKIAMSQVQGLRGAA